MARKLQPAVEPVLDVYALDVDHLGDLRAQIKRLQDQAKGIERKLKDAGRQEFNGIRYRVTVSCSDRARVDWKTVAERLEPSRQLVSAHTSHQEVCVLRVSAHKKGG